jgi:nitronate monooxygenase
VADGFMALHTAFTEFFSLQHPIALAPMGGASGGALAAAVSNGGGLGLVGGGREDAGWLDRELEIVAERTGRPWGVGFQSWGTDVATVEHALTYHPRAVMLSFGDPGPSPRKRCPELVTSDGNVVDLDGNGKPCQVRGSLGYSGP